MQYVFGILIIVLLLVLAVYFGWRQIDMLRELRAKEQMPPEDRSYFRWQGYRRLAGCALMILLAGLLSGLLLGIVSELDRLIELGALAKERGLDLNDEERSFLTYAFRYLLVIALVIGVLLLVAVIDLIAIRKYGMRHRRRIREDREAMLVRQLPQLRRSRNGHG